MLISVSDGLASASLEAFMIDVVGTATGSASISWVPPTENDDGSLLTDLAGYRIYWGTSEGDYPNSVTLTNPGLTHYVVGELTPARWVFVMTAVSAKGVESDFSNASIKTVF